MVSDGWLAFEKESASLALEEISFSVSVGSQYASNATNSSVSTATSTQITKPSTKLSVKPVPTTTLQYKPTTASSEKPTTILYELNTNYTPIIAVVGAGFGALVLFVCCMCVVHSWWLRKKKYTDVNSRSLSDAQRKQRKREEREAKKKEKGMKLITYYNIATKVTQFLPRSSYTS